MTRFYSISARSGRGRLAAWLVSLVPAFGAGILLMREASPAAPVFVGGVWGLLLAKLVVETARRCHDAGRKSRGMVAALTVATAALVAGVWLALLIGVPWLLYMAGALILLLAATALLPARDPGPNRWGDLPPGPLRPVFGREQTRTGGALAVVLLLLGTSSGYVGMRWTEDMRDARERAQRAAERPPVVDPGADPPLENLEAIYERQQRKERSR